MNRRHLHSRPHALAFEGGSCGRVDLLGVAPAAAPRTGVPTRLHRRRFLAITACGTMFSGRAAASTAAWRGRALGAPASITLGGTGLHPAEATFAAVAAEIDRLEEIFSLHRPNSALVRLNRAGRLDGPPAELVAVLGLCATLHSVTGGAFDPTVQPVWLALAQGGDVPAASRTVGWDGVVVDGARITLARPGMALTLNGVAQGYITDRIADLLRAHGYRNVLVDMGEIAALGTHSGADWQADVAAPGGRVLRRLSLRDRCLAVSAPLGTLLDGGGEVGHILDPRPGARALATRTIAVSANRAAVADGLSTGCALLGPATAAAAVARFPGATLEILI